MVNIGKTIDQPIYKHILEMAIIAGKIGKKENTRVYVVGGVVRDLILGKKIYNREILTIIRNVSRLIERKLEMNLLNMEMHYGLYMKVLKKTFSDSKMLESD